MHQSLEDYISQFVSLTEEDWSKIRLCFRPLSLQKNEFALQSGTVCNHIYFIHSGGLRSFYLEQGKEATRHFFFAGRFACALTSFLTRQPSLESLQALEETHLLRASYEDFQRLYQEIPAWQELGRKIMEGAYIVSTERIESLICLDATQRYLNCVATYPDIFQRVPQYHIASYLGVEPETLSRIRGNLARRKS